MSTFTDLLKSWEEKSLKAKERAETTITLSTRDLVKIRAFAKAYDLDVATVTEGLIHTAIKEAEKAMPYVKGSEVIRIEETEEVYADAGKTPAYVEAEKLLAKTINREG